MKKIDFRYANMQHSSSARLPLWGFCSKLYYQIRYKENIQIYYIFIIKESCVCVVKTTCCKTHLIFFSDKMQLPLGEAHACLAPPTAARWALSLLEPPLKHHWIYKSLQSSPHCPKVTAWHPLWLSLPANPFSRLSFKNSLTANTLQAAYPGLNSLN